jgi:hypothetical protein
MCAVRKSVQKIGCHAKPRRSIVRKGTTPMQCANAYCTGHRTARPFDVLRASWAQCDAPFF